MILGVSIEDVIIHMALEAAGGLVLLYALRKCDNPTHRVIRWTIIAFILSVLTVKVVG